MGKKCQIGIQDSKTKLETVSEIYKISSRQALMEKFTLCLKFKVQQDIYVKMTGKHLKYGLIPGMRQVRKGGI